ncbi:Dyp-type peroxidase [Jatrophihabitans sp.]|uniref:Dyp-type peroxidase n=1 Tax=Jatrophihabitans sp. TaxID=1932789 RepID=UPI002CE22DDC|nr:Dyp-type peroxidase [Jatrophihabitans sp.]
MPPSFPGEVSRRAALSAALGAAAAGVAGCTASHARPAAATASVAASNGSTTPAVVTEPFYGPHQPGVVTPAQACQLLSALDVTATSAAELRRLLDDWTAAAALLTSGKPVPAPADRPALTDTGEAADASASRLTITIGYGPSLFDKRFGLAARRPAPLVELPHFSNDNLQPAWCGGDLVLQVCADDAQIAFHAHRQLLRLASGLVSVRWSQSGFRGPQLGDNAKPLTRNLFGFHDGVRNPALDDAKALEKVVWAGGTDWIAGGSYLITRRILLFTDGWDDVPDDQQQRIIGRDKQSGAPLSGGSLTSSLDLAAKSTDGSPAIPLDSHVRLASAELNGGAQILRRSYAFSDGSPPGVQAGQMFCCFQSDPRTGFLPIQRRLSQSDALNTHSQHVGSAIFAIPPGVQPGQSWSAALFGQA